MPGTAISKGLRLLDVLATEPGGATVADIAGRLGISKIAARRLLQALVMRKFAQEDPLTRRYRLTLKLTRLGLLYLSQSSISAVYQPILEGLAQKTGELVRMAVAEGDRLVWVGVAQGSRTGLRIAPDTGREVNLHATASGKAWLATFPLERAVKLVLDRGFAETTELGPNAIRSVERLITELKTTGKNGFALSVDEYIPGMAAIAVPVRVEAPASLSLGTISIAAPTARMTRPQIRKFHELLVHAAAELAALWPIIAGRAAG